MRTPVFSSVLDLGLRHVGVTNQQRRAAAPLGKFAVPAIAAAVVYAVVACIAVSSHRVSPLVVVLAWPALMIVPVLGAVRRAPVLVVKVTADGRNQATWV